MSPTKFNETDSSLYRIVAFSAFTGACCLIMLSILQKFIAGYNPFILKAYVIPLIFGSFSGIMIGLYISRLKRSAAALQQSEEKYRSMMESMVDPVYICSDDFNIEYINPAMREMLGDEAVGKPCHKILHGLEQQCHWCCHESAMEGKSTNLEIVSPKNNRMYLVSNSPINKMDGSKSKLTIFKDITETRKIEKQLQLAQKMEAIGTLAGGVAHDFNNILSAIIGYTDLLRLNLEETSQGAEYVRHIELASNRAKDIVNQILTFSRQTDFEFKPVKIDDITREVVGLIRSSLPGNVDIKQHIQDDCLVMGDATQVHQVLINLCTNAGYALQEKGGILAIEICRASFTEKLVSERFTLQPGQYVVISIADNGTGMKAETIDRIFEPFFTTKPQGEGTGMGLSVVHGIVARYQGGIYVYSEPGQGTTFKIYLPAIPQQLNHPDSEEYTIARGTEHILYVDDDPALVEMCRTQLETIGYRVTTRANSQEALKLFELKADDFDLVITDMTMPGHPSGEKLAQQVKEMRPQTPVIVCTGFSINVLSTDGIPQYAEAILRKPVLLREMATVIRSVLDKSESAP